MLSYLDGLLDVLNQWPLEMAVWLFFITGAILVLFRDWRLSIAALLVQYIVMGMVLTRLVRPEIAMAKMLVGFFICPILYLSARQANWRHQLPFARSGLWAFLGERTRIGGVFPPGRAFRLLAILLLSVTVFSLTQTYPIANIPLAISMAVYWLAALGILILILTEDPLKIGQGLLTTIISFELWYTTLEDSLLLVGLWGAVNLLLALAIGYLTVIRGANLEEDF